MDLENNEKKEFIKEVSEINKADEFSQETYELFKNTWLKEFIISDLNHSDKVDIITYAQPVFFKFKKFPDTYKDKKLFSLILNKKIHDAVLLCNYLAYEYPEKREYVKSLVKKRDIFIISPKMDIEIGGIEQTTIHRANYLEKQGYKVTIVNMGSIKNYDYILDYYRKNNRLSPNVKFCNIYDYYSKKNTCKKTADSFNEPENFWDNEVNVIKTDKKDNSFTLKYYLKDSQSDRLVGYEKYIDDTLIYREDKNFKLYYTPDGFNYIKIDKNSKKVCLNDRQCDATYEFNYLIQLIYHFIREICLQGNEKPFMICDSSTHYFNLNGISLNHAFKIGALHANPFIDFDSKELNPRINHFKKINLLDKVVLLSEELKEDLDGIVDSSKLTVIPNFIRDEHFESDKIEKDMNTISIFARINPVKQLDDIIKAFKIVSNEKEDVTLNIYGTTAFELEEEELQKLKELTRKLNLENKVKFKGYTQNASSLMRKNLFMVMTSKNEGFPMALVESMANASPVICYNFKYGPKDLISDKVDGIIINKDDIDGLADAMLYLLNNPQIAIDMGKKAKEKIKNDYSIISSGQKWENLFIDLFIEKEVNDYLENISIKNRFNKTQKENKKLKNELEMMKKEIEELKNDEDTSKKFNKLKKLIKK